MLARDGFLLWVTLGAHGVVSMHYVHCSGSPEGLPETACAPSVQGKPEGIHLNGLGMVSA